MASARDFSWLSEVEARVMIKVDQPLDRGGETFKPEEFIQHAQAEYRYLWGRISDKQRNWGIKITDAVTITAGSRTVSLQDAAPDCRSVRQFKVIEGGRELRSLIAGKFMHLGTDADIFVYRPDQNDLQLMFTPTANATLRFVYNYYPVQLIMGAVRSAGSTSIQLGEHEVSASGLLVGQTGRIFSAETTLAAVGQEWPILAWDGPSRTATVATLATIPDTTARYDSKPILPPDSEDAFEYGISARMVEKLHSEYYPIWRAERERYLDRADISVDRFESQDQIVVDDELGFTRFSDPNLDNSYY